MEMILPFAAGVLLACVVAIIVLRNVKSSAEANLQVATARLQADLDNARENLVKTREDNEAHTIALLEEKEKAHREAMMTLKENFSESMAKMQAEVQAAADVILKKQQEDLKSTNRESVEQLMAPLRQQMTSINQLMTDTRSANEKSTASLEGTLKQMMEQTLTLGQQADNLANALKNKGKVHGDWGEQVLDDILTGSGLRLGRDYSRQEEFTLPGGKAFRPDVIINAPDDRRIIVDSKVSLTAYTDALAASSPEERDACIRKNYDSVWAHVKELSDKQYPKYVNGALEYVLMFMPNEGAYVMAMNYHPALAQEAFRQGVIILNPTNLMLALHLVLLSWNGTRQEENCQKILRAAASMLDKMVGVVDTCDTLVKQLSTASKTCETLQGQLSTGRGNLYRQVDNLRTLGVTSTKRPKGQKYVAPDDEDDTPLLDSPGQEESEPQH